MKLAPSLRALRVAPALPPPTGGNTRGPAKPVPRCSPHGSLSRLRERVGVRAGGGLQSGFSLIIVMMILVIVSIVGIVGAQVAMMGERGSRNDRDAQVATQAAETTISDAEYDILGAGAASSARAGAFSTGNQVAFIDGCGTTGTNVGLCLPTVIGKPAWLTVDLTSSSTATFGQFTGRIFAANVTSGPASVMPVKLPRYMIEAVPDTATFGNANITAQQKFVYRVTAIGFGPRDDIQTVVQMLYRKP
jgi:type IV pilus assembly protein PilX